MVSEGQWSGSSLTKLFWLRAFYEITVKLLVGLLSHSSVLKLWALTTVRLDGCKERMMEGTTASPLWPNLQRDKHSHLLYAVRHTHRPSPSMRGAHVRIWVLQLKKHWGFLRVSQHSYVAPVHSWVLPKFWYKWETMPKVWFLGSNWNKWKPDSRYFSGPIDESLLGTEVGAVIAQTDCQLDRN